MNKMLSLILIYLLQHIYGHTDIALQNDADLQAELMPQELNPEFVPGKVTEETSPWRALIPITGRSRRDTGSVSTAEQGVSYNLKLYSRTASCVALAVAALIEIVLLVLDYYK
ncbi:uncharacterized protein LOC142984268 [Anticarsia gemmatalis]|uniref:uncharacterized protein LOC142984268 n=1 Tax=Anticarsia gemmatalis TaxID=129554 RepID=UPI003F764E11